MRVIIAGGDGFCGWPTALHLSAAGHEVVLLDNLIRRRWDRELGTVSLVPVAIPEQRLCAWCERTGLPMVFEQLDLTDADAVRDAVARWEPEALVHFGEQSSAPYSMIDAKHAAATQVNNVVGTLNLLFAVRDVTPSCHLLKLGALGEYGTPDIDSFYHLSQVHDSHNILFACRAWGLRATELTPGIIYGVGTPHTTSDWRLATRYDYDAVFGTALNRFCVQAALGQPITVYGAGRQTRGFTDLRDMVRCVELVVERPGPAGELRVFNQFTEQWSVLELARRVQRVARCLGLDAKLKHVDNPRTESESQCFNEVPSGLLELGLDPHLLTDETIAGMLELALANRDRVRPETIAPKVSWRSGGVGGRPDHLRVAA